MSIFKKSGSHHELLKPWLLSFFCPMSMSQVEFTPAIPQCLQKQQDFCKIMFSVPFFGLGLELMIAFQKKCQKKRDSGKVGSFHRNGIYLRKQLPKNNPTTSWAGAQSTTCSQYSMLLCCCPEATQPFSFCFQSKNSSALMLEPE